MLGSVPTRLALAVALVITIPVATAAQDPTPEGTDWQLIQYTEGSGLASVPWFVDATLSMEDGTAGGSGGCNGLSGSYALDGPDLSFSGLGVTTMGCPDPIGAVEEAYLAALSDIAGYDISPVGEDELLRLLDADGEALLVFHTAPSASTGPDDSSIAVELEALQARVERHEERIKELESQVAELTAALAPGSGDNETAALYAAERVLLEAVPADIAANCVPRRSDNPRGTVAALQCPPGDRGVRDMAYYLMNEKNAGAVWEQHMEQHAVPETGSCWWGQPSLSVATGALGLAGCYLDADGRANLRYATEVTNCRQLDAGATHIKRPAVYIAVLGEDDDIAALTRWAEPREWAGAEDLVEILQRPDAKWDPSCPR